MYGPGPAPRRQALKEWSALFGPGYFLYADSLPPLPALHHYF